MISESLEVNSSLSNSSLFSILSPDIFQEMISHSRIVKYHTKNDIECSKDYFNIVKSGSISLSHVTHEGESTIIDILHEGDVFGISALLGVESPSVRSFNAIENSQIIRVFVKNFSSKLTHQYHFMKMIFHRILIMNVNLENELEHVKIQKASQQIICYILKLCTATKEQLPTEVTFPHDKNIVASQLGMTSETFSRALKVINQTHLLKIEKSKVTVYDLQGLRHITCDSCSQEYPCSQSSFNLKTKIY